MIKILRYSRVTKNGYVQIITNYGPLNLELYCKHAPKASENFIVHCRNGYYRNTKFHRLIKHFMVKFYLIFKNLLRYKEAIPLELVKVANQFGASHLRMKLAGLIIMMLAEF